MAEKPKVVMQGKMVVEPDECGQGFLAMFPDGEVAWFERRRDVERAAKKWAFKHADANAMNVLEIEWRGCGVAPGDVSRRAVLG